MDTRTHTPTPIERPVTVSAGSGFDVAVLENPMPVLVYFGKRWGHSCERMESILDELAAEYAGWALMTKVKAEEEHMLVTQYGVRCFPTILLFSNGRPVERVSGTVDKTLLRYLVETLLPSRYGAN